MVKHLKAGARATLIKQPFLTKYLLEPPLFLICLKVKYQAMGATILLIEVKPLEKDPTHTAIFMVLDTAQYTICRIVPTAVLAFQLGNRGTCSLSSIWDNCKHGGMANIFVSWVLNKN